VRRVSVAAGSRGWGLLCRGPRASPPSGKCRCRARRPEVSKAPAVAGAALPFVGGTLQGPAVRGEECLRDLPLVGRSSVGPVSVVLCHAEGGRAAVAAPFPLLLARVLCSGWRGKEAPAPGRFGEAWILLFFGKRNRFLPG